MSKIPLTLNPNEPAPNGDKPHSETDDEMNSGANTGDDAQFDTQTKQTGSSEKSDSDPIMGWCAVGFGVLSVFGPTIVFAPLAMICATIALFIGQAVWAFIAYLLAVAGILTSPTLLVMLGFATAVWMFDSDALMNSIFDWFGMSGDEPQQV